MAKAGGSIDVENARWHFGDGVSEHFDEHVARSVPLYAQGHRLVVSLSDFFLSEGSLCYDLGCSTGALTAALAAHHAGKRVRFVAVDGEPGMCERASLRCAADPRIEVLEEDIVALAYEPADLIVAYYTVQFVRPRVRQQLIDRLYGALEWGGALLMFEKVRGPDARFQDIMSALYVDHKLAEGFSGDEVVAKARSLKGVLEPFSTEGNLGLLRRAGFVDVMSVMKFVCFEGFLAIK